MSNEEEEISNYFAQLSKQYEEDEKNRIVYVSVQTSD